MNPRFLAYCRAHGMSPQEMFAHDREKYPGGLMCGFITWHSAALFACLKEHPEFFLNGNLVNHAEYDRWLDKYVERIINASAKVETDIPANRPAAS